MNADGAGPRVFEHAWTATLWRRQQGDRGYPPRIGRPEREWSTGHASMRCWAKPACFFEGGGCLDPRGIEFEESSPRSLLPVDLGGKSHYVAGMPTTALKQKARPILTVVEHYDVAGQAQKRLSLRQDRKSTRLN